MNAKKIAMFAAILSVPLLLGLNVAQAYRYTALKSRIEGLETEQKAWVENNKRLLTAIQALEAPERVEKLAQDSLGLEKAKTQDILRVELGSGKSDGD
jgi:hypothetical protein